MRTIGQFRERLRLRKEERDLRQQASRFGISLFDSIRFVPESHWDSVVAARPTLRRRYLAGLENSEPDDIQFRYALCYEGTRPVGAIVVQIVDMSGRALGSRAQSAESAPSGASLTGKVKTVSRAATDRMGARVLICGSAFLSGEHGFAFADDLKAADVFQGLADVLYRIRRADKLFGQVGGVLVKDFFAESDAARHAEELTKFGYRSFAVDPTMVVPIRPEWESFEDYVGSMTKKYRGRVKSVRKKGAKLRSARLSLDEIASSGRRIHELLEAVAQKAKFRIVDHPPKYFYAMKEALGDDFEVTGYFLEDRMVGFTSTFVSGGDLEGHYLGLDYAHNREHAVYQNILLDDVAEGIARRSQQVWLGRTALEIKSSIGAVPRPLSCYIRHRNPIGNRAMRPLFHLVKPSQWTRRNPFGET